VVHLFHNFAGHGKVVQERFPRGYISPSQLGLMRAGVDGAHVRSTLLLSCRLARDAGG
jgi:hypothetical protein